MTLAELVAITGMPGIFKVSGKRNDGLIVTSLVDGKTTFVTGRKHMFTTLDNITIYTTGEGVNLKTVFAEMKKQESENPTSSIRDDATLKEYVAKIIPDYDREKVYLSDMKKLVKWFDILNGRNLIEELINEDKDLSDTKEAAVISEKHAVNEDTSKPKKESKPKAERTVKPSTKPAPAVKKVSAPRKAQ